MSLKQIRGDDLVRAIRTVGAGQSLLDPAVTKGVLDRLRKGKHLLKDERLARLSPQEERILELVSTGRTNKEIGEESTWPRRRSRTTSPASWPSSRSPAGPKRLLPHPPHHHSRHITPGLPIAAVGCVEGCLLGSVNGPDRPLLFVSTGAGRSHYY